MRQSLVAAVAPFAQFLGFARKPRKASQHRAHRPHHPPAPVDRHVETEARQRERARIRAILFSDAGRACPDVAASLAFDTTLPRGEAIAMLGQQVFAAPARPPRRTLAERMAVAMADVPQVGPETRAKAPSHLTPAAAAIIAAGERARPPVLGS